MTWLDTDKFGIYWVISIAITKKTIKRDTHKNIMNNSKCILKCSDDPQEVRKKKINKKQKEQTGKNVKEYIKFLIYKQLQ